MFNLPLSALHNIVRIARHSDGENFWKILLQSLSDNELLSILQHSNLTQSDLVDIAYYACLERRIKLIQRWFKNCDLPQITEPQGWFKVVSTLHFYRIKKIKENPVPLMLAIFKAPSLKVLYPDLLPILGKQTDYIDIKDNDPFLNLRMILVEMAVSIPNGFHLLFKEWYHQLLILRGEKYFEMVWGIKIPSYRFKNDGTIQDFGGGSDSSYTGLQRVARYGNLQDIKTLIRHLGNNISLKSIITNKNYKVFRYFMELVWTVRKACLKSGAPELVWRNCYLSSYFSEKNLKKALDKLNEEYIPHWRDRIRLLHWLADDCTVKLLKDCFEIQHLKSISPRLIDCRYYHYNKEDLVVEAKPEALLVASKSVSFVAPYPIDIVYTDSLPDYDQFNNPMVNITFVDFGGLYLKLVYDVYCEGNWQERINSIATRHPYWKGPYQNIEDYNKDLELLIADAKKGNSTEIWWPIYIEKVSGNRLLDYVSKSPTVNFLCGAWRIANNQGLDLIHSTEIIPSEFYEDNRWNEGKMISANFPSYNRFVIPRAMYHQLEDAPLTRRMYGTVLLLDDPETLTLFPLVLEQVRETIQAHLETYPEKGKALVWVFKTPLCPSAEWRTFREGYYDGCWDCLWNKKLKCWEPIKRSVRDPDVMDIWSPLNLKNYTVEESLSLFNLVPPSVKNKQYEDLEYFCRDHNIDTFFVPTRFWTDTEPLGVFSNNTVICPKFYRSAYNLSFNPYQVVEQASTFEDWVWIDRNLKHPITGEEQPVETDLLTVESIEQFATTKETWENFWDVLDFERIFIPMIDTQEIFSESDTVIYGKVKITRLEATWNRGVTRVRIDFLDEKRVETIFLSHLFVKQEILRKNSRMLIWDKKSKMGLHLLYASTFN